MKRLNVAKFKLGFYTMGFNLLKYLAFLLSLFVGLFVCLFVVCLFVRWYKTRKTIHTYVVENNTTISRYHAGRRIEFAIKNFQDFLGTF